MFLFQSYFWVKVWQPPNLFKYLFDTISKSTDRNRKQPKGSIFNSYYTEV